MLVENTMPFKHNFRHGGILKEFSLKSGMKPGEVAVNAGISGPQMGELSQCSSSLWVRNQFLTARQITLGECLGEFSFIILLTGLVHGISVSLST